MTVESPTLELSPQELQRITGRKRAADQAAWIRAHYPNCPAHVNAANECIVIRAHLEAAREPAAHNRPSVRQVRKQG